MSQIDETNQSENIVQWWGNCAGTADRVASQQSLIGACLHCQPQVGDEAVLVQDLKHSVQLRNGQDIICLQIA